MFYTRNDNRLSIPDGNPTNSIHDLQAASSTPTLTSTRAASRSMVSCVRSTHQPHYHCHNYENTTFSRCPPPHTHININARITGRRFLDPREALEIEGTQHKCGIHCNTILPSHTHTHAHPARLAKVYKFKDRSGLVDRVSAPPSPFIPVSSLGLMACCAC